MGAAPGGIPGPGPSADLTEAEGRAPADGAELVSDGARLAEVARAASGQAAMGLDLEGDGMHRYPAKVCLVQVSVFGAIYLIDPLSGIDMAPLGDVLADPAVEKIVHSADHDLRCLDRDWGFHVRGLFDTAIAAAFLGHSRMGLATVLSETLGIEIPKSRRLQKSDWSVRPLGEDALRYAASDVAHLLDLRKEMGTRLAELGRAGWVAEECERLSRVRHTPPDPETAFLSIKGSHALDPAGLAVLRELADLRERHALRRGRPPFWVMSNEAMVTLAADPGADPGPIKGIGAFGGGSPARDLGEALRRGIEAPPYVRPRPERRPRPRGEARRLEEVYRKRLDALKAWRKERAAGLCVEPSLVWPIASMERIAREPESAAAEMEGSDVRRWQAGEFGPSLAAAVRGLAEAV